MEDVVFRFENHMAEDQAELETGIRRGDRDVLDLLIEKYQHRLLRYLLSLTGNRPSAEDLFQETWVRVLERGHQYRGRWKFEVWLFSIARHLVIDLSRRKTGLSLDELRDPARGAVFEPPAHGPSPLDEVQVRET